MEAAHTSSPDKQTASERRCLVTGEVLPKDDLIRFVVAPDNSVVPDLAQNLPGRGLWVSATYAAVDEAAKKNLFSKAAKTPVKVNGNLANQLEMLMHKRCLDFLGLARRSGIAILGQPQVEAELKNGQLALLLIADDAGSDLSACRAAREIRTSRRFTRNELGSALGHDQLVYAGLKPNNLTSKLVNELARLEKIATPHHISSGNG